MIGVVNIPHRRLFCTLLLLSWYRVSKKSEFYRIEHLQIGFPSCYRQLGIFVVSYTKTRQDQAHLNHVYGKIWPTAPIFGYDFWAQVTASLETNFSPKITTKVGYSGIFSCLGLVRNDQKTVFRDMLPIVRGESNLQMLNMVKLTFF